MRIIIYTDGSCDNQTGVGSFGFVVTAKINGLDRRRERSSEKYTETTNNRMELKAIIAALEHVKPGHQLEVYSDSQYCVRAINEWLHNWVRYRKLDGKANPELWRRFLRAQNHHLENGSRITYSWVRGHNGTELNELADELAGKGRLTPGAGISCQEHN